MLVPVLTYGSEIMIWREKERSRIRAVQMTTSEVCWVSGEWIKFRIRQLWWGTKCVDGKIDEGVLRWFDNVERIENEMNAKRVYVGVCW